MRATIRRLRSGVVPLDELERLSVGYGDVRRIVTDALSMLAAKGRSPPIFVQGEWGAGKSHMLEFIRATASRRGMAHVRVDLNARDAALNFPQRFYPWFAESVRVGDKSGLRCIIEDSFLDPSKRDALLQFAWASASGTLGGALRAIIMDSRKGGHEYLTDHPSWDTIMGTDLPWADWKRGKALERFGGMALLLRSLGAGGLVAVFDEVETIEQLWNRLSRLAAYETLGTFCTMDAVLAVFSVTGRFDQSVKRDLDRNILYYVSTKPAGEFVKNWRDEKYRIVRPPTLTDANASELEHAVLDTYSAAYPISVEAKDSADEAVALWISNPGRNPRRLIRSIIDALDSKRLLEPTAGREFEGQEPGAPT